MNYYLVKSIFTLAILLVCGKAAAQVPSGLKQIQFVDLPATSGQTYRLFISLPDDYAQSGRSYPVLYILDADFNFVHLANVHKELVRAQRVPEAIVIGIGYGTTFLEKGNNRWQDFSPTYLAKYPGSGQAHKFRAFLSEQLKPFIAAHYRTSGVSTIHGHSMAGLFLTYLLFQQPDLFDRYLITSPSLWWDGEKVFDNEKQYYARRQDLPVKLFLTVAGKEGKRMRTNWAALHQRLTSRNYTRLVMGKRYYADQNHIGVIPDAFTDGLLFLFGSEAD